MSYATEVMRDNPVGYWRLGETSGTDAVDEAVTPGNGTYTSTYTLGAAPLLEGDNDPALTLAATGYVSIPDKASLRPGTGAWSAECWFQTSTTQQGFLICKHNSASPFNQSSLFIAANAASGGSGDHLCFTMRSDASNTRGNRYATTITDGAVHHVVGTWAGGSNQTLLYVDGVSVTTVADAGAGSPNVNNTVALNLGGLSDAGSYTGTIDECAVYNTVLSAARVQAHYLAGVGKFPAERINLRPAAFKPGLAR